MLVKVKRKFYFDCNRRLLYIYVGYTNTQFSAILSAQNGWIKGLRFCLPFCGDLGGHLE